MTTESHEARYGVIMGRYPRMFEWSLRNRFITLTMGALIFVGSIVIAGSFAVWLPADQ